MAISSSILTIDKACKAYKTHYFLPDFFSRPKSLYALENVSLSLQQGEVLGIIGESGSGKTTLGKAIVNLTQLTSGTINLFGKNTNTLSQRKFRAMRGDIQMIFQDLDAALNPNMKVVNILSEIVASHRHKIEQTCNESIVKALSDVHLSESILDKYPSELSGGQKRRVSIAAVLLVEPQIIIADEPTSGLDAHVQRLIVNLLVSLQQQRGLSLLLISHDLTLISEMCHKVAVMYRGNIIETGLTEDIFSNAAHPYTQQLVDALRQKWPVEGYRGVSPSHQDVPYQKHNLGGKCRYISHCLRYQQLNKPEVCRTKSFSDAEKVISLTHTVHCYFPS